MKLHGFISTGEIDLPCSFTVEGDEKNEQLTQFEPELLKDQLTGAALIAYKKYTLKLKGFMQAANLLPNGDILITHHETNS